MHPSSGNRELLKLGRSAWEPHVPWMKSGINLSFQKNALDFVGAGGDVWTAYCVCVFFWW